MNRRYNSMCSYGRFVFSKLSIAAIVALICVSQTSSAGTFSWGDLDDPNGDVMYLDVTETNMYSDALFAPNPGSGSPTVVGNQILFDPQNFLAERPAGGGADLTDSTLTTVIMAKPNQSISSIFIEEFGDYTLGGLGAAEVSVGAAFFWTILEIDNVPVNIPTQTDNMTFTTGAGPFGGEYASPGDDGTAVIWEGDAFIDVADYLASNNIEGFATKVRLRFDNTLTAAADQLSNAFIKKKEIGGVIITVETNVIPEPSSAVIASLAVLGAAFGMRRLRGV